MKKYILLYFITLCVAIPAFPQSPNVVWDNTIGGTGIDYFEISIMTPDSGFILGGRSSSDISFDKTQNNIGFGFDYWIVKTDKDGVVQWDKTYGGTADDELFTIDLTSDGGYILGGKSYSNISGDKTENRIGDFDFWVVKVDSLGVLEWENTIGGTQEDNLYSIEQTSDGGYILGGMSRSNISPDKTENSLGSGDYWVVKLNSLGVIQWDNTIGGTSFDGLRDIHQTTDGGYILAGYSFSDISLDKSENAIGLSDFWIVKLNSLGVIVWDNTIGGTDYDYNFYNGVIQTADGGYLIGGESESNISGDKTENATNQDFWVLKLNALGVIQWQNTIGGSQYETFRSLIQTSDGGYLVGGWSPSNISGDKSENSNGNNDYWIVKLNNLGIVLWDKTVGGNDSDRLSSIIETHNNGILLGGTSYSNISGDKTENGLDFGPPIDYWIVKLDFNNCSISNLSAGNQTACNPLTNRYTQEIIVNYTNEPNTGNLVVNGQSFAITSSPQTVILTNLTSDGNAVNVTANFSTNGTCSMTSNNLFTAPVNCIPVCSIDSITAGNQTACVQATNSYTQVVTIYYQNQPNSGSLFLYGNNYAITGSPQTITLTNLTSDGQDVFITSFFTDENTCTLSVNPLFTAPEDCSDFIWTGATNTDWNTASNWNTNAVPAITDNVHIPIVANGNYPILANAITLNEVLVDSGATMIIQTGIILTNTFTNNGKVVLKDGAYLDDFTNFTFFDGEITVEVDVVNGIANDQRLISSPVNMPSFSEIADDLNGPWGNGAQGQDMVAITIDDCNIPSLTQNSNYGNLFEFQEPLVQAGGCSLEGWVVRSSGVLENGKGYSAYLSNGSTFDFTGTPNSGFTMALLDNSASGVIDAEGWNLVGNPFPSPISRNDVINAGVSDAQYYQTSGTYQGTYSPYLPGSNIAIGQGFQVYTNNPFSTLMFDNNMRNTNPATWYENENWFEHKLEISVSGNGKADKTILFYNNEASENYEPMFDVVKRNSKKAYPTLSTENNNKNLALNGMSVDDIGQTVPLNLSSGTDGNFILHFEGKESFPFNTTIYLKDLFTNTIHNIENGDYSFSSLENDNQNRFELIFIPTIDITTTKVSCSGENGSIKLSSSIGIENRTFDLSLNNEIIATNDLINLDNSLSEGVYTLKVIDKFGGFQTYVFEIETKESIESDFAISNTEIAIGESITFENLTKNANQFEWLIESNWINNVNNLSYSFESEGEYEILLKVSNDECEDITSKIVTVLNKTTSIDELKNKKLNIYPNPASEVLNIDFEGAIYAEIFNVIGKKVKTSNKLKISIKDLDSGIYRIVLYGHDIKNIIVINKFIKK